MSLPSTIAHYRITSKLGEGGMGEVYRATDTKLNREVAIKVLPDSFARDPDRMARFAREAQVLASLNHPNIAAIYGVEDRALVMELVEGPTLAERIERGPIQLEEALLIARQISEALEYAHEKAVIHRDLKPANIKLTLEGKVKVLDFGLAKALSTEPVSADPAASPTLTMRATLAGVIMGTAAYMSPEQARGAATDRRADIWSFGVLFYEMLTARQIFGGDTVSDSLAAVLKTDPDWAALPKETPLAIRRLLRRCLERDRKQRLPDIAIARLEIDEALGGSPETVDAAAPVDPRGISRAWFAAVAVLALAGAVVGVMHFREAPPEPQILRYTLPLLEKTAPESVAISPDGHYVVLAGKEDSGAPLWVRALDSLQGQPLAGTEGTTFPFWSPDSRHIGFFASGKLKRIAVNGGPAQTLCDAPVGRGGSWNRDGVILFVARNGAGVSRVPAGGGVPVSVISATIGTDRFPVFLPDGRRFLYLHLGAGPDQAGGIFLGSLDSQEIRMVAPDRTSPGYAPPTAGSRYGHLLFMREDTLMAQPMDPKSMLAAGELFPVAEQVATGLTSGTYGSFAVSDNGVLIYQAGHASPGWQHTWFDRDGKQISVIGNVARTLSFGVSPDGKRIVIERPTGGFLSGDLWIYDVERGGESRFTTQPSAINRNPVWAPDGSRVVFASNRERHWGLYQRAANGVGQDQLLLQSGTPLYANDWSRDGRFVIYSKLESKTGSDIWALPVSGDGKPIPLLQSEFGESNGQVSPDGLWLAYVSNESRRPEVYVQPFTPGAGKSVGGKWPISVAGGVQPRWRGDGKELFYLSLDRSLIAVDVKTNGSTFDHGSPHALFAFQFNIGAGLGNYRYAPSSDGKRFLVSAEPFQPTEAPPLTVVVNWHAGKR